MKDGRFRLLVINPGSTSTKVSLFEDETALFERSLFHDAPELLRYPHVNGQMPFRYGVILDMLRQEGVALPDGIMTVNEMAVELCRLKSNR